MKLKNIEGLKISEIKQSVQQEVNLLCFPIQFHLY